MSQTATSHSQSAIHGPQPWNGPRRLQWGALAAGALGLALCLVGAVFSREQFFQSYLFAVVLWTEVALGCVALVMLHHLVGGGWGFVIRRLLESGALTLPLLALLFVPLLFGLHDLYAWARPDEVAADAILRHKQPYLNVPFFIVRAGVYFAVWTGMALLLNRWSLAQDRTGEPALLVKMRRFSAAGLILYAVTATFAAVDWVMSLEPEWFSSIFGMSLIVGEGLVTLAFAIVAVALLARREPLAAAVTARRFNDLGNLLLTFVVLWTYMAFAQYLIIWSGNLPEEISWYLHRSAGGWQWIALGVALFHFALPFLALLSRDLKRQGRALAIIAALIIAVHVVYLFWLVAPAFHQAGFHLHWLDVAAPVGVGGVWLAAFLRLLGERPLLPLHDPRFQEAEEHA